MPPPPLGSADLYDDRERIARLEAQIQGLKERVSWLEQSIEARVSGLEKSLSLAIRSIDDIVTERLKTITQELKPFKWLNYLLAGALLLWAFNSMFTPTPKPGSPPPAYSPKGP